MEKKKMTFRQFTETRLFQLLLPVLWVVLLIMIFTIGTGGDFLTIPRFKIIFDQCIVVATVATGASFVYASGNVNIAMGATTGMIAAVAAQVGIAAAGKEMAPGTILAMMVLVALAVGVGCSYLAVILSTKFHVKVLYITVVMMTLLLSVQQVVLNNSTVQVPMSVVNILKKSNFLYVGFALFLAASVILFNFTKLGRTLKFVGTNPTCSDATGIENDRYLMIAFLIAGVGAVFGAFMTITRTNGSIGIDTANSMNMDVMLAIVLGGMSVFGGSKSYIHCATLGAFTVVLLNSGLMALGVDSIVIQAVRGVFFLVLVIMSQPKSDLLPEKD